MKCINCDNERFPKLRVCRECRNVKHSQDRARRSKIIGSRTWLNNNKRASLRDRARKRGLEFNLKTQDLADIYKNFNGLCPYCNKQMNNDIKKLKPVVDRIDNSKGYIVGNCVLVCWKCNSQKLGLIKRTNRKYV